MEFIFDFVVELILDGTIQISKNQKVPKLIRYPLMIFILLLFLGVTLLIFFTGILSYQKINKICGIIFIVLGIVFFIASIIKLKNIYIKKKTIR